MRDTSNNSNNNVDDVIKIKLERPTEKKKLISLFYDYFKSARNNTISKNMEKSIPNCGNYINFLKDDNNHITLGGGYFCRNRFCPFCSWRKAMREAYTLLRLLYHAKNTHKQEFLFLTLTIPNVSGDKLEATIKEFNQGFKRLYQGKRVKTMANGFIRKLEITHNAKANTYHPHFHCIIAVDRSYFTSRAYIKHYEWLTLWRKAMRMECITQVDIRKCKFNDDKAILEVATYSAKHSDLLKSKDIFKVFYEGLFRKQVLTYNGVFKELKKLDKMELLEDNSELTNDFIAISKSWYKWQETEYQHFKDEVIEQPTQYHSIEDYL